ncbi:hypothetical protein ISCGN_031423 [Ixodes scapularis]
MDAVATEMLNMAGSLPAAADLPPRGVSVPFLLPRLRRSESPPTLPFRGGGLPLLRRDARGLSLSRRVKTAGSRELPPARSPVRAHVTLPPGRVVSFATTVVFSVADEANPEMSAQHREPHASCVAVRDILQMCVEADRGATGIIDNWPFLLAGGSLPAATTTVAKLVRHAHPCEASARSRRVTTTRCGLAFTRWGHPVVVRSSDLVPSAGVSPPM